MSLKALHVVFVSASVMLAGVVAFWGFSRFLSPEGTRADLVYGIAAVVSGLALLAYGRYFLNKLKNISYL
jgi:hypothetical protein